MKIIDISARIYPGMTVYKDKAEKRPSITPTVTFEEKGMRESRISLDSHTGTHADGPKHMLKSGKGVDSLPLAAFVGPCRVLDLSAVKDMVADTDLARFDIKAGERILLKTRNSKTETFDPSFVSLAASGAAFLAKKRIALVGIDALGIERAQPGRETHTSLLGANIAILEGLRLRAVKEGPYLLCAQPLSIADADGAPCRAILLKDA